MPRPDRCCRRDALDQEHERLLRRTMYPGGRKARAAARRLRTAFGDFIPARCLDDDCLDDEASETP